MAGTTFNQKNFRIRNDDGNETGATWRQALDTNDSMAVTTAFRVRFFVQASSGGAGWATTAFNLYYSKNAAAYATVSGSTPIQFALSSNFADGADTTRQIGTGGNFIADNNGMKETTGGASNAGSVSDCFEAEWNLTIDSAQAACGDTFDLQVRFGSTVFLTYTVTPRITVSIDAIDSNATSSLDNYIGPSVGASAVGQSFTGNGLVLEYARFYCHQDSSPDGTITAKIYAHTGTFGTSSNKTGSALATSDTFNCSSLPASFADQQFTFSGANRITIVNTTKYVVLFETSGMTTGLIYHRSSFSNPHAGNLVYDYGADGSQDMVFGVYGSALATTIPNQIFSFRQAVKRASFY